MLVTINTDASFHPELKHGAYAFWAVSNEFKITKSGVFKSKCINPDDAEAKCILNAFKIVLSHPNITKIIVNTDSLNAIAILKNDKAHIASYMKGGFKRWIHIRRAYTKIMYNKKSTGIIEYRHVKAHTGISDKRSYVNEWCDAEAKKQLRAIKTIK